MKLDKIIEWSLYILLFSTPFSNTAVEICAIISIICWLTKKSLFGLKRFRLPQTGLNLPLALFYVISFLSIFWSTHPNISLNAFLRKLSEYLLLYLIVFEAVNERRVARNMIIALAASAFIVCIDGLYQRLTGFDFIRGNVIFGLPEIRIDGVIHKFEGFKELARLGYTLQQLGLPGTSRLTASFKFPNGLSAWLALVSLPFVSLALFYKKRDLRLKAINSILAFLLVWCLINTYTRGAIISFIFMLALMLFLRGTKRWRRAFIVLLLALTILMLALPADIKAQLGLSSIFSKNSSAWHRLKMWQTAWRMFIDRPLLGQGLNTFMANYERFRGPKEEGIWYAHNCYLQMAAETGIFGLLSFLWMFAQMAVISLKSWHVIEDDLLRYTYLGLFCGIAAFLMQSAVEMSLYSLRLAVLFYSSLGLLMGIRNIGARYGKVQA